MKQTIYLLFNETQQAFHFDLPSEGKKLNDWRRIGAMSYEDASSFIKSIDRKHLTFDYVMKKFKKFKCQY